jgi:hypothetical protein
MMYGEKVIQRIRKLFRLAKDRSASINEAASALRKMQELLDRYQLSLVDIIVQDESQAFVENVLLESERLKVYDKYIFSVLQTFFHVVILRSAIDVGYRYTVVGTRVHIEIAKELYVYLKQVFIREYQGYQKKRRYGRIQSQSFYMGIFTGLYRILQEHQCTEELTKAIMIYDKAIYEYILLQYGNLPEFDSSQSILLKDPSAYVHGEHVGTILAQGLIHHMYQKEQHIPVRSITAGSKEQ